MACQDSTTTSVIITPRFTIGHSRGGRQLSLSDTDTQQKLEKKNQGKMVKIPKLKTKSKRMIPVGNCALELSGLLQCWATTSDVHSIGNVPMLLRNLSTCMKSAKTVNTTKTDSINFHLARLGKNFK
ncbi:hypothetical protein PSTT_12621 [Puccinia striiformis]|uniref:Uncharacterized protein n=1 Tax=Puccinia striiformis TaxID=27350 RepID=A0A2S4UVD8_9BASI|nr:hypothetical protein PSTT_12621 [Puccinia striiformis]